MTKAEETRSAILKSGFQMIYRNGYKATSIESIIAHTRLTKGAFFYHFKSKDEMGIAILKEVLMPVMASQFAQTGAPSGDPLETIYRIVENLLLRTEDLTPEHGCPVANLISEVAPANEIFCKLLDDLSEQLLQQLTAVLEQGKRAGQVNGDVNARATVQFVLAGYWGIRSFGKLGNAPGVYASYLKQLKRYLSTLK